MSNKTLDEMTEDSGYPTDIEVQPGLYMTGSVDRDKQVLFLRMGNDELILESILKLDELYSVIRSLGGNADELEQVIGHDAAQELEQPADDITGAAVRELLGKSDYSLTQMLWNYVEDNDLWDHFAAWAAEAVESGSLLTQETDNG